MDDSLKGDVRGNVTRVAKYTVPRILVPRELLFSGMKILLIYDALQSSLLYLVICDG
jgi:hypothetical protein